MSSYYCIGPQQGQPECPCKLRNKELQDILYPNINEHNPIPPTQHTPAQCSKYGIVLEKIMGYVCTTYECLTFAQVNC